jgi:hypothetical protein
VNRDLYINYRKNNDVNIIYEFYKEKFDNKKHTPFIPFNQLVYLLQNTGYNIREVMDDCLAYFDNKFSIVKVYMGNELISFK